MDNLPHSLLCLLARHYLLSINPFLFQYVIEPFCPWSMFFVVRVC